MFAKITITYIFYRGVKMEELIEKLITFGFTRTEALVYLSLVKAGQSSGYKISKDLNISRSSIYQAIEALFSKGFILLLPGETKEYVGKDPDILFNELEKKFVSNAQSLKNELNILKAERKDEFFLTMKSEETIFLKIREIINSATQELYINSDFDLSFLKEEFKNAIKRKVRIIIFSFKKHPNLDLPIETLYLDEGEFIAHNHRLMIVCDLKESLVVDNISDTINATSTNNELFIRILAEHIHHDIYLLKLKEKYGNDVDDSMYINTEYERRFCLKFRDYGSPKNNK